ncbi:hypothetical protein WHX55_15735 [Pseudomonas fluorescens]|uniref:hypothetical protein n=1 Tax=Pseudomonas fluorescens TaxID=294 RepID=UPI00324D7978
MTERKAKPTLTLKNKPTPEVKPEELPANPITAIEVAEWDYTPEEDFQLRQRKRRKDKHVEQYRKEAKWQ